MRHKGETSFPWVLFIVACLMTGFITGAICDALTPGEVIAPKGRIIVTPSGILPGSTHLVGTVVDNKTGVVTRAGDTVIYFDNETIVKLTLNEIVYHSMTEHSLIIVISQ